MSNLTWRTNAQRLSTSRFRQDYLFTTMDCDVTVTSDLCFVHFYRLSLCIVQYGTTNEGRSVFDNGFANRERIRIIIIIIIILTKHSDLRLAPTSPVQAKI